MSYFNEEEPLHSVREILNWIIPLLAAGEGSIFKGIGFI
jgi:hypothetical protein